MALEELMLLQLDANNISTEINSLSCRKYDFSDLVKFKILLILLACLDNVEKTKTQLKEI